MPTEGEILRKKLKDLVKELAAQERERFETERKHAKKIAGILEENAEELDIEVRDLGKKYLEGLEPPFLGRGPRDKEPGTKA